MHELGVVIDIINTVEDFAKKNGVTRVETLVMQIGELSSMIPKYIESCYPAAVDGTLLEHTALRIEIMPGNGRCRKCAKVFNLLANGNACPLCGGGDWEILSGKEFMIKEIVAC